MIAVLKGVFEEFDVGIIKDSNFEGRQFLAISAKFWGSPHSPQSDASV